MTPEQMLWLKRAVPVASLLLLAALEGWLPFWSGRAGRLRHYGRNVLLGALNVVLVVAVFSGPLRGVSDWVAAERFGVVHWLGLSGGWALLAGLVLFDGWMYAWHRANHRIGFLWRFHRVHHSERDLDVTSAVRFHPGEIAMSTVLRLGVLALLGVGLPMLLVYEMALAPVIQFHHSNVRTPGWFDDALRTLIVSPNMHRVHHSELRAEHDGNYASIFSFWDRMFGSHRRRADLLAVDIGLGSFRDREWLTLAGMMRTPLRGRGTTKTEKEKE